MAPRKPASAVTPTSAASATNLAPPLDVAFTNKGTDSDPASTTSLATDPLPTVRVNNANLGEIKGALDDIVKKYLLDQSFTPSILHPSVHLGLGYSSVLLALTSVLYSLRVNFEDSKPVLWVAVVGYSVLQSALWAWKRWVEKGEVFKGRRRRMVKRIETDHVQIISSTTLSSPPVPQLTFSPHTRPSSPTSVPTSPISPSSTAFSPPTTLSSATSISSSTTSSSETDGPSYLLHLNLSTTSNSGKSLIHRSRVIVGKTVGEFVDEEGGVEEGQVVRWLTAVLSDAGLVGAEDEAAAVGTKEE